MFWRRKALLRAVLFLSLSLTGAAARDGAFRLGRARGTCALETTIEGVSAYLCPNGLRTLLIRIRPARP